MARKIVAVEPADDDRVKFYVFCDDGGPGPRRPRTPHRPRQYNVSRSLDGVRNWTGPP